MQQDLNRFIQDVVLEEGYSLAFNELNVEQLTQLKFLVETVLVNKTEHTEDHQYLITLFKEMDGLVEQAIKYDMWDELWGNFWDVSNRINILVHIDWHDPDASEEEDIMARYYAVKEYVDNLN